MKKSILALLILQLLGCAEQPVQTTEQIVNMGGHNIPIVKLDHDRYKIGNILLDKAERHFEIPGKFLRKDPPIEFLAVAKDGSRGYESLLELNANVYEFNLACILIGLEANKGNPPKMHFDPTPVDGDAVEIWLSWNANGQTHNHEASELFQFNNQKLTKGEWVYSGSSFLQDGRYMPEQGGGTLVGIIHDPASIIEHRTGFGRQSYSELKLDPKLTPPENTAVTVKFDYFGNTLD